MHGSGALRARYPHASVVDGKRGFPAQAVYIKFIGTHAEYDKIDVASL